MAAEFPRLNGRTKQVTAGSALVLALGSGGWIGNHVFDRLQLQGVAIGELRAEQARDGERIISQRQRIDALETEVKELRTEIRQLERGRP